MPLSSSWGLFSVAAVDNIDHSLSTSTAASAFHETAASITQFPSVDNVGIDRSVHQSLATASDDVSSIILPLAYSDVPPSILPRGEPKMPAVVAVFMNLSSVSTSLIGEYECVKSSCD